MLHYCWLGATSLEVFGFNNEVRDDPKQVKALLMYTFPPNFGTAHFIFSGTQDGARG